MMNPVQTIIDVTTALRPAMFIPELAVVDAYIKTNSKQTTLAVDQILSYN